VEAGDDGSCMPNDRHVFCIADMYWVGYEVVWVHIQNGEYKFSLFYVHIVLIISLTTAATALTANYQCLVTSATSVL